MCAERGCASSDLVRDSDDVIGLPHDLGEESTRAAAPREDQRIRSVQRHNQRQIELSR
jgi:hypothetical protein